MIQSLRSVIDRARTVALAASKRARIVRKQEEFRPVLDMTPMMRPPLMPTAAWSWELGAIMDARDQQMAGRFLAPARLAESMRTDDALAVAYENRLAPQRMIKKEIVAAKGNRAGAIAAEAEPLFGQDGIAISDKTMDDINGALANHNLAIGYNIWTPRADGSRIDVEHHAWPLEFVWWDSATRLLMTRIDPNPNGTFSPYHRPDIVPTPWDSQRPTHGDSIVPIVHGDGRWVVYSKSEINPWRTAAALLPAAMVWSRHAFGARDWSKGSSSHGNAKIVGTLPEQVPLQARDAEGFQILTAEAASFLKLLQDMASQDVPVGIKQAGATIDYLTNSSGAWEVWERLMLNAERAAARIYLGTDGTLGATGGAPGVDIDVLFGVAQTRVVGDLQCITRAFHTGTIEPWAAINFGDSACAPHRRYMLPDSDADADRESFNKRMGFFNADIKALRDNGFILSQEQIDQLAEKYELPAYSVPVAAQRGADMYAYEIDGGIFTIDEVRRNKGYGPMQNGKGSMTVPEVQAAQSTATTPTTPTGNQ